MFCAALASNLFHFLPICSVHSADTYRILSSSASASASSPSSASSSSLSSWRSRFPSCGWFWRAGAPNEASSSCSCPQTNLSYNLVIIIIIVIIITINIIIILVGELAHIAFNSLLSVDLPQSRSFVFQLSASISAAILEVGAGQRKVFLQTSYKVFVQQQLMSAHQNLFFLQINHFKISIKHEYLQQFSLQI